MVDTIDWIKKSKTGSLQANPGFYCRHAKETCLIGLKGNYHSRETLQRVKDVIEAERREHSRKPDEIYATAEALWPGGQYLDLFGRNHNLRKNWKTVGNQIDA